MKFEEKPRKKRRWFIWAGVAVAIVATAVILIAHRSSNGTVTYKPIAVERGDIDVTILSTGTVQPENRLEIKPPIAGRVEQVLVNEGERVKKGQVLVLMSSSERAALLDAARARGQDELQRWEGFYRPTPILAPIDGTIILRSVEPGQSFTTQEAVLVMSDRLTVKAQVDETDIAEIKLKQPADVILDAYPESDIPSSVDKIAFDATTVNNVTTYIVDVLPENTPVFMRSGMTANVSFQVESKKDILMLPTNAVRNKDGHHYVLVPSTSMSGKPEDKEVGTGVSNGKLVEIVSGLAQGDVVLVPQTKERANAGGSNPFSPFGPRRTPAK